MTRSLGEIDGTPTAAAAAGSAVSSLPPSGCGTRECSGRSEHTGTEKIAVVGAQRRAARWSPLTPTDGTAVLDVANVPSVNMKL